MHIQPGYLRRPRPRSPFNRYSLLGLLFVGAILYQSTTLTQYVSSRASSGWLSASNEPAPPIETSISSGEFRKEAAFRKVTVEDGFPTSAAHCSLSTMNEKAWEGAMCSLKNLCYDPKTKEFIFYKAIPEIAPPPHPVNLGKKTKFYPKLVEAKLPLPRYEANKDETWILMEMNDKSLNKLEDFLRDDLFAWWLLSQHATWADQMTILRPLATRSSPGLNSEMRKWYTAFPFAPLLNEANLDTYDAPVCFPRLVVGLGSMTDTCWLPDHDFHEQKRPKLGVAVEAIPCATGRGPLYYRLREIMISRLSGAADTSTVDKPSVQTILFAEESDDGEFAKFEESARALFADVNVLRKCVSCLSPTEQMELALNVAVYVTRPAGPQTLAAHLLRRGAGVVLLEKPPFAHTNFAIWNNLAYVRARWVQNEDELMRAIQIELEKAESFM